MHIAIILAAMAPITVALLWETSSRRRQLPSWAHLTLFAWMVLGVMTLPLAP